MTMTDAVDRACLLWGATGIVQVSIRADGGADVSLFDVHERDKAKAFHQLNAHGQPTCHGWCQVVAEALRTS